ncbi:hypothetical protein [Nonomuraea turcica]|uniref:hypothetical protein n=1 Tax=Nonomuraea sp. G32 TaxID=3067274 RepID=UPI00273CD4E4|nr:hypothetical protein [Nonomuraea sp. G32]MDP4503176.1 hypothetical protein [Nonomuraea sp. G32]
MRRQPGRLAVDDGRPPSDLRSARQRLALEDTLFPVGDLIIKVGVCLGIALAAAATAVRFAPGRQAAMAAAVVQPAMVLGTILLPQQVRLWPPTYGFGYWDQAHLFWLAMLPLPYLWLNIAGRDLRR